MKLVKACSALAAFAAIFVVPSIASAIELTSPTGTTYKGPIIGTNVAHSNTQTEIVMTTSIGNISCTKATITGEVIKDSGTHVLGTISTVEVAGTTGVTTTGHCAGTGILGSKLTPTPSHTSDETKSLPWCITFGAEDIFEVWKEAGGSCESGQKAPVTFTLHGSLTCGYEKASVIGTYTTHPADLIATIVSQTFTRSAGSSAFCPATGTMDMAFTLTTDKTEGGVEKEGEAVYIDK